MTDYASGTGSRVAYVPEVTMGTTPGSPSMIALPATKLDLEIQVEKNHDTAIYGDRMERFSVDGLKKVQGSISGSLSATNFNALVKSSMFSDWASDVIKPGLVASSMTFEQFLEDITKGWKYQGCIIDKMSYKMPVSGPVTFDASVLGFTGSGITASLDAAPTAAADEPFFVMVTATLQEGGATIAYVTSIEFEIDNGSSPLQVLGSQIPIGFVPGAAKVSGTLKAFVPDLALFNKFIGSTSTSLSVQCTDGTKTLTFEFPATKYTSFKAPQGGSGALEQELKFETLRDGTAAANFVITRSA
jgi:hypothetical protein